MWSSRPVRALGLDPLTVTGALAAASTQEPTMPAASPTSTRPASSHSGPASENAHNDMG